MRDDTQYDAGFLAGVQAAIDWHQEQFDTICKMVREARDLGMDVSMMRREATTHANSAFALNSITPKEPAP